MTNADTTAQVAEDENPQGKTRIWTDLDLDAEGKALGYLRVNVSSHGRNMAFIPIPLGVFNNGPGPRILVMGGAHGDEFEGQVLAMKLMRTLDIGNVKGRIIVMPAANAPAAFAGRRTSPLDEGNLNRLYPGDPDGTPTQEIAYYIDSVLLPRVDYLLDFHSGSVSTYFVPSAHVYYSPDKELFARSLEMLRVFGMPTSVILRGLFGKDKKIIGSSERHGVLRFSTELGGGGCITVSALRQAEQGLARLLHHLGALREPITNEPPPPTELVMRLPHRQYVYAMASGVFEPFVEIGEKVRQGQQAGAIHFPAEPWREPWVATFPAGGTVHAVRIESLSEIGDALLILSVPWRE